MPLDQELLDSLWDFSDARASEERFRAAGDDPELRTQLARALGLQGRFAEADAVLDSIADDTPVVRARRALERGRLRNSAGDRPAAIRLFTEAERLAHAAGSEFLEIDAVHMLAIADEQDSIDHAERGIVLAEAATVPRARRWAIALHNNLGWALHDAGDAAAGLVEFEASLAASKRWGTPEQEFFARWAIGRALRSLGRNAEALALQEELRRENETDEYVLEELGILRGLA
jgi:tetratricopeptide (TPR) repeat protein